jgi:hypothetical protein
MSGYRLAYGVGCRRVDAFGPTVLAVRDTVSGPIKGWHDVAGEHARRVDMMSHTFGPGANVVVVGPLRVF